jgi:hypothetical protein
MKYIQRESLPVQGDMYLRARTETIPLCLDEGLLQRLAL